MDDTPAPEVKTVKIAVEVNMVCTRTYIVNVPVSEAFLDGEPGNELMHDAISDAYYANLPYYVEEVGHNSSIVGSSLATPEQISKEAEIIAMEESNARRT